MEWPLTGRDSILDRLGDTLDRGDTQGIAIVGEAGVGKSRLAQELVRVATARGRATEWVSASRAMAPIPLGAFAHLFTVPPNESDELRLLGEIRAELAGRSNGNGPIVLVVDDANLLDDRSSSLMHHLAVRKAAFVVVTSRTGAPASPLLTELWKDGLLERVELGPLSQEATAALLEAALGDTVEPLTLASLWRRSDGNALYLRELVLSGLETGGLVREPNGWRLTGAIGPSARLVELVETRLGLLDPSELDVVQTLAVGGSVGLRIVEMVHDPAAVERLEERRLIEVARSGNRDVVSLTHPIYAEVIAARLTRTRAKRIMRWLGDHVEATGARRRDDLLRMALWRLDGGGPATPGVFVEAARRALAVFDALLAERLARAALAATPGDVSAELLLGRALASQQRVDDADAVFATATANARTDDEIANVALARAHLLYFRAGRIADASSILATAYDRVSDANWRDEIDSLLVLFRAGAGDLPGVAAAGRRLAARSDALPRAVVHALMYSSIANVMLGRLAEAEAQVRVGLELVPRTGEELPLAGPMLHINRAMAHAYGGRVARSLDLGSAGYRGALESEAPEVASMWAMNLAECLMLAGQLEASRRTMLIALSVARERDPFSVRGIDTAIVSILSSWLGRHDDAFDLRQEIIDEKLVRDVRSRIQFDRATVWVEWHEAGVDSAAGRAVAAGDRAAADTHLVWAAWLFHDAVRLGRPELVVDRLGSLAASIEGELVPTICAHASALGADDAAALDRVSVTFERLGSLLFAAEAAAQAHQVHLRRGEPRLARLAGARASILAARCPGARTPALSDATPVSLTPRELEVARWAAAGMPSKAIGQRLRISVRTVDNHLAAVYGKLGATGRADLPALFGPSALQPDAAAE